MAETTTSTTKTTSVREGKRKKLSLGDHVIIYQSRDAVDSVILTSGLIFQSRFGHYKHDDLVGVEYGTKVASSNGKGFVYVLLPTPELWTLALPHRTQILYLPDIAFITSYLDVKPGTKVIEAGTGSGSFSHSLARSVGSSGQVYSYEYNEERYHKALAEFSSHSLSHLITLRHSNVYRDGFVLPTPETTVDSIFLDLPAPWEAISQAKDVMRRDRTSRICCFSPCIEQVLKTVEKLSDLGFSDITMYETLTRSHDPVATVNPPISFAINRIKNVEQKKERRRETQIAEAKRRREAKAAGEVPATKKAKTENGARAKSPEREKEEEEEAEKVQTFKAGAQARGHTSYLTFATLLPLVEEGGERDWKGSVDEAKIETEGTKASAEDTVMTEEGDGDENLSATDVAIVASHVQEGDKP